MGLMSLAMSGLELLSCNLGGFELLVESKRDEIEQNRRPVLSVVLDSGFRWRGELGRTAEKIWTRRMDRIIIALAKE